MKQKAILAIVLFFVLGSTAVTMSSLSSDAKSVFYAIAAAVLLSVGMSSLRGYGNKSRNKQGV